MGFVICWILGLRQQLLCLKLIVKYSGDIIIPEKVKGNDGVEYVVTSLGDGCFGSCSALTSITIPSSVTSLGERCFYGCSGLETVSFKGKVSKNTSQSEIPTTTIIKVPTEYLQDYKDAIGYRYKYILPGILMDLVMITSRLHHVPHHLFLTHQES